MKMSKAQSNKIVCSICENIREEFQFSVAADGKLNPMCMACQVKLEDGLIVYVDGKYILKYVHIMAKRKTEPKVKKPKDEAKVKERKRLENLRHRIKLKRQRYYNTVEQYKKGKIVYSEGHIKRANKHIAKGLLYCRGCFTYLYIDSFPKISEEHYFDTCNKCLGFTNAEL